MNYLDGLDQESIQEAIKRAKRGVEQYLDIQSRLRIGVDPREKGFQKAFNAFYRVSRRSAGWYESFYGVFFKSLNENWSFQQIVQDLYERTGMVEASFSSKIRASIDTNSVVIDSIVLSNVGLQLSKAKDPLVRLRAADETYTLLSQKFLKILESNTGTLILQEFKTQYPSQHITDIKALDFTLWQLRGTSQPHALGFERRSE